MKKFIAVIQTKAGFKTWVGIASDKFAARELYKHIGCTVSLMEYSKINHDIANQNVKMYNNI
jgi:hypothetical protein